MPVGGLLVSRRNSARAKFDYAVPGLCFNDREIVEIARPMPTSAREDVEIADLPRVRLSCQQLHVEFSAAAFDGSIREHLTH
jgi:dTDP-glucose pyrophosphorylase